MTRSLHLLTRTSGDWTLTALRLLLALIFFPHGAQKLLGWFGGYGFTGTMGYFTSMGIPYVFGVLAILAEIGGAIVLLAGLGTRIAAIAISVNMVVAALMV
ncbi:MAG TPA: DoxX family protein, partial [Thermoanaerobaculia bacterium]|nr:DoxX family protein [Thermoanaerobaculia bacterium]